MGNAHSHLPNRLKKYRKLMNYSQKDIARILKLKSASIISRWENGASLPNVVNLFKLSILYRRLADQLYFELIQELRAEFIEQGVFAPNDQHYC